MLERDNKAPTVTMIAGPNGSGKSTLTASLFSAGVDFGIYINADDIDRTLDGQPGIERSVRAQAIANERRNACLANRQSFTFETVMSHVSKVDFLTKARLAGYLVVIYFVALETPTLNVERVRQRVALGGHPVPEDRIVARYERCLSLLPQALAQADRAVLFDNSYRDREGGRINLAPFCEVRRVLREPEDVFEYLSADGTPLEPGDTRIPLWSRPLLAPVLPEAERAWRIDKSIADWSSFTSSQFLSQSIIDFDRRKRDIEGTIKRIEYDPVRSVFIALVKYEDGELAYILAPQKLAAGDKVIAGKKTDVKPGNAMELGHMPIGTIAHNVETTPGGGGKIARAAGTYVQVVSRDKGRVIVRLNSGERRNLLAACMGTVGAVSNPNN